MKSRTAILIRFRVVAQLAAIALLTLSGTRFAAAQDSVTVYSTAFEAAEDYDEGFELAGQNGWVAEGTGGNGLLPGRFPGEGVQGYLGTFEPLNEGELATSLWRPVNYAPVAEGRPIVTFTVDMEISDSTNDKRDDFRWSAYNTQGNRLFTVAFNNNTTEICYILDDQVGFRATPYSFLRDTIYTLEIVMDFANNLWSARLDSAVLLEAQPITTTGAPLNLGDIDAVWAYLDPDLPGDNFMAFDNYTITAAAPPDPTPSLTILECLKSGETLLRLTGLGNTAYAIETSEDLTSWTELKTASASDGVIEHLDTSSVGRNRRFYRGRLVE